MCEKEKPYRVDCQMIGNDRLKKAPYVNFVMDLLCVCKDADCDIRPVVLILSNHQYTENNKPVLIGAFTHSHLRSCLDFTHPQQALYLVYEFGKWAN